MKKLLLILLLIFLIPAPSEGRIDQDLPSPFDLSALTEPERARMKSDLVEKLKNSVPSPDAMKPSGIPLDVRASIFIIEGLATIASVIYKNLLDVIILLIWIFFAFWLALEAWTIMQAKTPIKDSANKIVKKSIIVMIAMFALNTNPAEWFMLILGGVSAIGNSAADLFLGSATGMGVAQSCGDTYGFVLESANKFGFLGPESVANVICLTGRITEFFYTGIFESLKLISQGIGLNIPMACAGLAGVILFGWCILKFTFLTLGVVIDITLMLMFLPLVAFKECFKGGWEGQDIFIGKIIEKIANAFGDEDVSGLIQKFTQVVIYIIAIALIASICYMLMQGVMAEKDGFLTLLLGGALCAYMISQTNKWADKLGGKVESEWTDRIGKNAEALFKVGTKYAQNFTKLAKDLFKK